MGELIADLLALPSWAPRMILRTAGAIVALTLFLEPATFYDGMRLYADQTAARLMRQVQPLLEDLRAPDPEGSRSLRLVALWGRPGEVPMLGPERVFREGGQGRR